MTKQKILKELYKLKSKNHVDKKTYQKFLKRLQGENLLRFENPQNHFCVFFLPFDKKTKSIFLGHHIKANDWIPPGGHIEENENPLDTIQREMAEELSHNLTIEEIEFFDITIKHINKKLHPCKVHWDLWYLIHMPKKNFTFDKTEFYTAQWLTLKKAQKVMRLKNYNQTVQKLKRLIFPQSV